MLFLFTIFLFIVTVSAAQSRGYLGKEVLGLMLLKSNFRIRAIDKMGNILQQYDKN